MWTNIKDINRVHSERWICKDSLIEFSIHTIIKVTYQIGKDAFSDKFHDSLTVTGFPCKKDKKKSTEYKLGK